MREDESNWFSRWEEQLPPPEELMPLSQTLTFLTGCGYLGGAVAGTGVGLVEGVKSFESGDTMKLRVNRILNSSGHTGRTWGNRLGVIGLLYAGIESGITAARDTDDVFEQRVRKKREGPAARPARRERPIGRGGVRLHAELK